MPRFQTITLSNTRALINTLSNGGRYHNRDYRPTIEAFMSNGGRNVGSSEASKAKREKRKAWLAAKTRCDIETCTYCEYLWPHYQTTMVDRTIRPGPECYCGSCFRSQCFACIECETNYHADDNNYIMAPNGRVCQDCTEEHYRRCDGCNEYRNASREYPLHIEHATTCLQCVARREQERRSLAAREATRTRSNDILPYSTRAETILTRPWLQLDGERTDRNHPTTRDAEPQWRIWRADDLPQGMEWYTRQRDEHPREYYQRIYDDYDRGRNGLGRRGGGEHFMSQARLNLDRFENGAHPAYNKAARPTLWLGFEIEAICKSTTNSRTAVPEIQAAFDGRGIIKSDSSIRGDGFEMVSLPGTLAYHQTQWKSWLKAVQKHMTGWSQSSCGMHVHLSRRALTAAQITKAGIFLNATPNRGFVEHVAGRGQSDYARIIPKRVADIIPGKVASIVKGYKTHKFPELSGTYAKGGIKYNALNTSPQNTVEVRIFQSNVASVGFIKNIEFCHAVFAFVAQASFRALTTAAFLAWLDVNRGQYPNLTLWCVRETLLTKRHNEAEEASLCA